MDNTAGVLLRPFDNIKTRPGHNGQPLSYIEGHEVVLRLIEAFGLNWSFRILQHEIGNHEVFVLAELKVGDTVKQAFGGSDITKSRDGGKAVSIADDLKAAATDALKKSATLLGVGLHLYGDQPSGNCQAHGNGNGGFRRNGNDGSGHNGGTGPANDSSGPGGRITRKQLGFLNHLAQQKGMDRAELEELCRAGYGKTSAYLSSREASLVIDQLQGGVR